MTPDFEIFTNRLHLRIPHSEESVAFASLVAESDSLHRWLDWSNADFDHRDAKEFIVVNRLNWVKNLSYGFAVVERSSNQFLGMVALTELHLTSNMATVGYWIADKYQRKGYAKEALEAMVELSFDQLKLTRLEVICDPDNQPSHNVALSCGAVKEGIARNRYMFAGKPRDGVVFSFIP